MDQLLVYPGGNTLDCVLVEGGQRVGPGSATPAWEASAIPVFSSHRQFKVFHLERPENNLRVTNISASLTGTTFYVLYVRMPIYRMF